MKGVTIRIGWLSLKETNPNIITRAENNINLKIGWVRSFFMKLFLVVSGIWVEN